jgi:hypothetical protein
MDKDASPKIADDVSTTSEPVDLGNERIYLHHCVLMNCTGPPVEPTEIMVVPSFWTSFKTLLSVQFIFFNVTVMMLGMGVAVIGNFLFIFLRTDLNASGLLLGVDMIFTVLLELPFFFFGKQLLEKIGIRWMMVASTASLVSKSKKKTFCNVANNSQSVRLATALFLQPGGSFPLNCSTASCSQLFGLQVCSTPRILRPQDWRPRRKECSMHRSRALDLVSVRLLAVLSIRH